MNYLTFLGTGTSVGIPQIACTCPVCTSDNPKDKRLRTSILIETGRTKLLIDCGPDFRQQFIVNHLSKPISNILLTHEHYDHVGGLDDVRPLGDVNVFAEKQVLDAIRRNLHYCFGQNKYAGVPNIHLHRITEEDFYINDIKIEPVRAMHAQLPVLGFKINDFAYLTDVKTISEKSIRKIKGVQTFVLNALRKKEHISHLNLSEALNIAKNVQAKQTYFIHLSHDMGLHDEIEKELPKNIHIAYDGLKISI
ncbi:MAG: MBL fold metallo-hydrolase [Prevotellaceae bacterium]|jgi:phosphoribosyl 1,2-cyclic phosphate phosphodiesterase|nr:MBL fold metallo-hydrolase [Prevotellaceae bacterium]